MRSNIGSHTLRSNESDFAPSSPIPAPRETLYVDDCTIESDLEMYFSELYVPSSAERMLLYRELDNIEDDRTLEDYRKRLIDRFGPIPEEGEELLRVVLLRRLGKRLGCEKISLRGGKMVMQFVSNPLSAYYQSKAFDKVLNYIGRNPRRCAIKEVKGRRLMHVDHIATVADAVDVLKNIDEDNKGNNKK